MENNDKKVIKHAVKKCHYLEGKHFIVIDESIIERLHFFGDDKTDLYFQQELTQDGCISLRRVHMEN